ncbi:hypothetical protein [Streptomyces curacoi]|uniref:Uncharacterized protein n=1 Tax=Streptomyces curacoi TaxID=146536 RepID=A0A124GWM3_9ACTN|nr:hypothetical protein [Streptomyces curacoi]KUM70053.1 hypothetical protein AQI70_30955 [Streptomyces curacoi]
MPAALAALAFAAGCSPGDDEAKSSSPSTPSASATSADTGSARLTAEDKAGQPLQDTFTVTREKGTWHLVVFTQQPAEAGKEPASTDKPSS